MLLKSYNRQMFIKDNDIKSYMSDCEISDGLKIYDDIKYMIKKGKIDFIKELLTNPKTDDYMVEHLYSVDNNIHALCIKHDRFDIFKLFQEQAEVNWKNMFMNKNKYTQHIIFDAAKYARYDFIEYFLMCGYDLTTSVLYKSTKDKQYTIYDEFVKHNENDTNKLFKLFDNYILSIHEKIEEIEGDKLKYELLKDCRNIQNVIETFKNNGNVQSETVESTDGTLCWKADEIK